MKDKATLYHRSLAGSKTREDEASALALRFKAIDLPMGCNQRFDLAHLVFKCISPKPESRIGLRDIVLDLKRIITTFS